MNVDLNKKLRYRYSENLYAEEVGRYNNPEDYDFMVVFRGDGSSVTNTITKRTWVLYPAQASVSTLNSLENYPVGVPWDFDDIEVDAWYRFFKDKTKVYRITKIDKVNEAYEEVFFSNEKFSFTCVCANMEYTLDNPLDPKAVWHPCSKEVAS